jgi:hypothetical protein
LLRSVGVQMHLQIRDAAITILSVAGNWPTKCQFSWYKEIPYATHCTGAMARRFEERLR